MELVSVIVPIYNSEKYLEECVDSILANTYTNLEVILVDDGSSDASPAICDAYVCQDERVRVIHKKNSGIGDARNAGLAVANGTYVTFVDSDDVLSPVLYEQMTDTMEKTGADIVTCEYRINKDQLNRECTNSYYIYESLEDQISIIMTAPWMRKISWTGLTVWNKLYRKSRIIHSFRSEYPIGEDLKFNWDFIRNSRKMAVVPSALYFYRQHEDSVINTYRKFTGDMSAPIINGRLFYEIASYFPSVGSKLNEYLDARAAYSAHSALWRIFSASKAEENSAYVTEARNIIKANYKKMQKDRDAYSIHVWLFSWLSVHCFWLWRLAACSFGYFLRWKKE